MQGIIKQMFSVKKKIELTLSWQLCNLIAKFLWGFSGLAQFEQMCIEQSYWKKITFEKQMKSIWWFYNSYIHFQAAGYCSTLDKLANLSKP